MRPRTYTWLPLLLSLGGAFLFLWTMVPYLNAHAAPYRAVGGIPAGVGTVVFSLFVGALTFVANSPGRLRLVYAVAAAVVSAIAFLAMLLVAHLFLYGLE